MYFIPKGNFEVSLQYEQENDEGNKEEGQIQPESRNSGNIVANAGTFESIKSSPYLLYSRREMLDRNPSLL